MLIPILLVVILPFLLGIALSPSLVAGLLPGVIVSGLQFASSATTSGEAWSSAKRLIESGRLTDEDGNIHGPDTLAHRAALIGNSVGYVLKKNAGCTINSCIKLMGMLAVLFGSKFA
jgi:H+-translocating diphosphatase